MSSLSWNDLLVNPVIWGLDSCLEGAVYGVLTACSSCSVPFNQCLINALSRLVYEYQDTVEEKIRWGLTPRYREEEIEWAGNNVLHLLKYPDVVEINVKELITTVEGFESFSISPYIMLNATIEPAYLGADFCVAVVPVDLVDDPDKLLFWRTDNNVRIMPQRRVGYPEIVDGNWRIALDKPGTPGCADIPGLNVQHCEYMVLEVAETDLCDGELLPVYPNTTNKIPLVKREVLENTNIRFWFYAWSLVKPNLKNTVDLSSGEFYKLYDSIDFRCFSSVEQLPVVTEVDYNCVSGISVTTDLDQVQLELIDAQEGKVFIHNLESCECTCVNNPKPIKLKIWYRTDPTVSNREPDVSKAREALVSVIASELPVKLCNCGTDIPYLAVMQTPYDNIRVNQFTGAEIISQQYGSSLGRKKYEQKISEIRFNTKVVKL